jgi:para-nitrobenzyl esterase
VVWLHGGAWLSGAGSLAWYGGRSFAANGIVAVGVNYRLGALGFLRLPGVAEGNLGLLDQVAALAWVRANIAAFGGDPDNVTVMGQSAGGHSIAVLMTMPAARGLFRRAIIQSAPMGLPARAPDAAAKLGVRYAEGLGLAAGDVAALKTMPVAKLLEGQITLARSQARFADVTPPFLPVADGTNIPGDIGEALAAGAAAGIDIIIGTTREEMAAFYSIDKAVQDADEDAVARQFASVLGEAGPAHRRVYEAMRASRRPIDIIGDLMTDLRFRVHSLRFAERQAALGRPAYVYQFDWPSPQFAACHCLEIPFMFDNLADWPGSPMLAGADAGEMAALANAMHGAWVAFARSGDPNHDGLPPWRPYDATRRTTMRFDRISGPVDDLAGVSWRPAWPV